MRAPFKATVLLAVMVLFSFGFAQGQEVYVLNSEIAGLDGEGNIPDVGADLEFPIHFVNTSGAEDFRTAVSNGYYFLSPDGVTIDSLSLIKNCVYNVDLECAIMNGCYPFEPFNCYSWFDMYFSATDLTKGLGGLGIAGLAEKGTGLPPGFDDWIYAIKAWGVSGPLGAQLVMDTTYWEPGNFWLWTGVGANVGWTPPDPLFVGGFDPCPEGPFTTCWPNPFEIGVNDNDRVLNVSIHCEDDPYAVDLGTVKIFGKIPCYTNEGLAWVEGDSVVTNAYLMRFLGSGGFRPLPADDYTGEYWVTYSYLAGGENTLYGDFLQMISQGDVNFDGAVNNDDVVFMIDYLFHGGEPCTYDGYRMDEFMDFDQSGRFDLLDIRALIEYVY
ncbi:MAG: hypothetical protein JSV52_06425 [Candidatus Zixiibacteriota bacterium]|nr:MAG: hypothetical protein JSV52_06425 [candidate division Zixibacteria bacterium]